jgi:hypothetical protein
MTTWIRTSLLGGALGGANTVKSASCASKSKTRPVCAFRRFKPLKASAAPPTAAAPPTNHSSTSRKGRLAACAFPHIARRITTANSNMVLTRSALISDPGNSVFAQEQAKRQLAVSPLQGRYLASSYTNMRVILPVLLLSCSLMLLWRGSCSVLFHLAAAYKQRRLVGGRTMSDIFISYAK